MFHFAAIFNFDAFYEKCAEKTILFNFLVKLFSTLASPYFQLHKMLCLSFIRAYCKSDPPGNILCKTRLFGMSGVLFLKAG